MMPAPHMTASFTRPLAGHSILLIEPDMPQALDLQDALVGAGARVFTAYSLRRAIAHAEQFQLTSAIISSAFGETERAAIKRHLAAKNIGVVALDERLVSRVRGLVDTTGFIQHLARLLRTIVHPGEAARIWTGSGPGAQSGSAM